MSTQLRTFFDHSRHKLWVRNVTSPLDVLAFEGREGLSQVFNYRIEFTCTDTDIAAESMLGKNASFSLYAPLKPLPYRGFVRPEIKPLRALNGVVSGFRRLSRIFLQCDGMPRGFPLSGLTMSTPAGGR